MPWYSKSEAIILDSLKLGRPSTDKERIRQADQAIGYYVNRNGYQVNDLEAHYKDQFKSEETWKAVPKTTYNLVKPVADTLSRIYTEPVIRRFKDEKLKDVLANLPELDSLMQLVDLYTLISGVVAVRPIWDEVAKRVTFGVYYGNEVDVTPDPVDPSKIMQLRLSWKYGGNKIEHIWEADRFCEMVDDKPITPESEQMHRYGRIPFVVFNNTFMPKSILGDPASDLVAGNRTLNWLTTVINDCVPIQIAGLLVTKGAKDGMNVRVGQRARLDLPNEDGADAKYIQPGADIEKGLATINLNLEMFFSQRNIPESAIRATQLSGKSGVAFIAEQESLVHYYKRRQNVFGPKDAELCQMIVMVDTYHRTKTLVWPEAPAIKYHEYKTPMSSDERAQWDWEILNGVSTPLDYLMAKNQGMAREDAEKKLAENTLQKFKGLTLPKVKLPNAPV